ncbi:hypothetical protein [Frigoriglobus tundricola]|uniref:Glycosyltransferase RgtA/B/C/D-like domain-containing protein n=1 Tax=Frigoriglobus tundricola TaxID=2774151 RepID=A0A6M5YTP3_9BACT|nr:hypothetical protein [Frigoriglobus tundricola]QJW97239.1 hypothetical protein FTUN_4809 [Frigoriglobus tundricola]
MPVPPCIPWRSVRLAQAVTAVALVVGLPLFLRSPPWCDLTLYQLAARNILHGGVHYRDLFDTNLPGFVWMMTALSAAFGPNAIAVRLLDLVIVAGVLLLIDRMAKWGGATPAARWWAVASAALFYPYTEEMAHAQRDTWMALPALAAVALRVRRGTAGGVPPSVFRSSFYEGLLWGAAVWMKPHAALMALAVWLVTVGRIAGEHPRPWRAARADLLGNLSAGLLVGAAGVVWLIGSGAWGAFLEVFLEWNPRYTRLVRKELYSREREELFWFPPWSLGLVLTVPLALLSVLDMAPWASRAGTRTGWLERWAPRLLWDKAGADARFVRGALGALYLVWAFQAFLFQRGYQYVHVPETLLMLGIWAAHRWAWAGTVVLWLALSTGLWAVADHVPDVRNRLTDLPARTRERYLPRHPIADPARLRLWAECWRLDMPDAERYALWDALRQHPRHESVISWVEIAEVADFLRTQGAGDGTVVAWYDSTHAAYLLLDVEPGLRYMHVYTAIHVAHDSGEVKDGRTVVMGQLRENRARARYVISDLEWLVTGAPHDPVRQAKYLGPPRNPPSDLLPEYVPTPLEFPFNQPTLFRSRSGTGRYLVHQLVTCEDNKK